MSTIPRMAAALAIVLASLAPLALPAAPAHACSCAVTPLADELRFVDTVFSGTVTDVGPWDQRYASNYLIEVTVEADHLWLGAVERDTVVRTAASGASCGYTFEEGTRYLVYAKASVVSLCSPTQPYDDSAVESLEAVTGPGTAIAGDAGDPLPRPSQNAGSQDSDFDAVSWAIVLFASLAGAGAVVFVAQRR